MIKKQCNYCHNEFDSFTPYGNGALPHNMTLLEIVGSDIEQFGCPVCGAHDRERHLKLYCDALKIFEPFKNPRILHFAPEKHFLPYLASYKPEIHIKADLFSSSTTILPLNVEAIPYDDNSFDIVIANHILEHVSNVDKALSEINRVLKSEGIAILQTPYSHKLQKTFEDAGIDTDELRLEFYGQEDHVRLFGEDIFNRFSYFLDSSTISHTEAFGQKETTMFGVNPNEPLFLFHHKPSKERSIEPPKCRTQEEIKASWTRTSPLVSISCITYNHEHYITETLESFLMQQTDFPFEIVIGEDCSTDNTRHIIESYRKRYPDLIRVHYPKHNTGFQSNMMQTLKACRGDFIALCEGDDYWSDWRKLQKQINLLENDAECVMTYAAVQAFNNEGIDYAYTGGALWNLSQEQLQQCHPINTLTVCFRNVLDDFPVEIFTTGYGDLFLWSLLGHYGHGRYIDSVLPSRYRIHDGGAHSSQTKPHQYRMLIETDFSLYLYYKRIGHTSLTEHFYHKVQNDALVIYQISDISHARSILDDLPRQMSAKAKNHYDFDEAKLIDILSTQTLESYLQTHRSKPTLHTIGYLHNPLQSMGSTSSVTRFISPLTKMDEKYHLKPLFSYRNGSYEVDQHLLEECKVIIIHNDGALFDDWIPRLKEMGKVIIYALDEFYFHIPIEHPIKALKDAIGKKVIHTLQQADFLMVPTKMLEHACNAYEKPVHLISSYPDSEVWNTQTPPKIYDENEPVTIALFAEFNEKSLIKQVLPALGKIKKKYGEKVRLVIYSQTVRHEFDKQFSEIESYKINAPDYINFSKYIQTLPIDFYLCPVPPDPYYASKDPLSFYELSLCRLPGIFTNSLPYQEVVINGETGIVCPNDESSWVEAMSLLIDHPALRAKLGNNAFESVTNNFMVDHHLSAWDTLLTKALAISREPSLSNGSLPTTLSRHDIYALERYEAWQEIHDFKSHDALFWDKRAQNWHCAPHLHIGCIHNSSTDLALLADTIDSLAAQLYENWQLTVISDMASPNELFENHPKLHWIHSDELLWHTLNELWSGESDENWLGILRSGDRLYPHTLASVCESINRHEEAKLLYSDHDEIGIFGKRENPQFKPDLNLDMLRSTHYIGDFFLIKGDVFAQIGSFNLAYMDAIPYDLLLRAYDCIGAHGIHHIEDILYSRNSTPTTSVSLIDLFAKSALGDHLERNGLRGTIEAGVIPKTYSITYLHPKQPLVSIIIPTKNQFDYIKPCLESILEKTTYPHYEIIIVDNGSDETETVDFLFELTAQHPEKIKLIPYLEPFNYSRANNIGAHHAQGEFLFLLNNDTVIIQDDWLEKLLSFAQRDDVGIVGARLLYPRGTIQHAGVILGLGNLSAADHHFIDFNADEAGYMNRLIVDQNYSAVTAAALLIKTEIFHAVNGLNEIDYQVNFSDVDLCLKVKETGFNIVWTPHVTLIHHGSVSQQNTTLSQDTIEFKNNRFQKDLQTFIGHWSHLYDHESAFNRHLDMKNQNVVINIEESVPWGREESAITKIWAMPRAYDGGGEYRILSPMRAIHSHGLALTHTAWHYIDLIDMHRAHPDVWLLQTPLHDQQIDFISKIRASSKGLIIFEIDDLLTNIPIGNNAFFTKYHDMDKRLPKAIKMCDRLIVSTKPLAQLYGKYSQDVRIVPNYLDGNTWRHLKSTRRNGDKPRVGWAGGISHRSDLEIISKVVKELSNEIDWIFFGMCPQEMLPFIHECHAGVSLDDYPQKLASMDLDLALAPLETNVFNEAKSHLRLLEYGIMGWPIIATDIYPYQGDAPITRVKNRYTNWKKAIQEKLRNREVLATEGDAMREWVLKNWMIEDHIEDILPHYLP